MSNTFLRDLLEEISGQVRPVDLSDRVSRTAKRLRRRRAATSAAALVLVVATAVAGVDRLGQRSSATVTPGQDKRAGTHTHGFYAYTPLPQGSVPPASLPRTGTRSLWRMVYVAGSDVKNQQNQLQILDGEGHLVHAATVAGITGAAVSPDGSLLAYGVKDSTGAVTLHEALSDGSGDRVIGTAAGNGQPCPCDYFSIDVSFAFSPDDSWLAVADSQRMILMRPDGSAPRTVRDDVGDGASGVVAGSDTMAWSPDSAEFAFATQQRAVEGNGLTGTPARDDDVFRYDVGTGQLMTLTSGTVADSLAWSPSGVLAYHLDDGRLVTRTHDVVREVANVPGHGMVGALSWSPDGSQLAVLTDTLRLVTLASSAAATVPQPAGDTSVVWLPDGNLLVANLHSNGRSVYDPSGNQLQSIAGTGQTPDVTELSFGAPAA